MRNQLRAAFLITSMMISTVGPTTWAKNKKINRTRVETVEQSIDHRAQATVDDVVAMHWNYICQPITDSERDQLDRLHRLHLDIVNADTRRLAGTTER